MENIKNGRYDQILKLILLREGYYQLLASIFTSSAILHEFLIRTIWEITLIKLFLLSLSIICFAQLMILGRLFYDKYDIEINANKNKLKAKKAGFEQIRDHYRIFKCINEDCKKFFIAIYTLIVSTIIVGSLCYLNRTRSKELSEKLQYETEVFTSFDFILQKVEDTQNQNDSLLTLINIQNQKLEKLDSLIQKQQKNVISN